MMTKTLVVSSITNSSPKLPQLLLLASTPPPPPLCRARYALPVISSQSLLLPGGGGGGGGGVSIKPSSSSSSSSSSQRRRFYLPMASPSSSSSRSTAPPTPQVEDNPDVSVDAAAVLQLIKSHQESAARLAPVDQIRTLLEHSVRGMLSTFSQKHAGYPSGSMVDFACDHSGFPILAVSSLALHTKDLLANPKCSMLVARDPDDRTDLIVTLYGDAMSVSESDRVSVRSAYLAKHPDAFWVDFGDFQFMRILPTAVRYVSGVATASLGSGEFSLNEYEAAKVDPISQFSKPVASHMNKDHAEDTRAIVQHSTSIPVDFAHILDLDCLGLNVKVGLQGNEFKLRIPFPRKAADRKDVKTLIVEMLQAVKSK